ncbi:MAG: excinuclease ABC subunit UvrA [Paludibacteraceae bacterium]|nr:excinuclease ABC subunit UvrA [Paludibacteraceae bacterium]
MKNNTYIEILGARVHNLKNVDVRIPHQKLTVITGLSGSGKSSLAFDTLYAEGQRRYIETFSAYARNFLGGIDKPDVDEINGLSPVIAIEQKTTNKNPRSTVGTITEIYDFLRLLYARAGEAFSYVTGKKMVKYTEEQIISLLNEQYQDTAILLLSPVVKGRKGHYHELFEQLRKKGFLHVRVDGILKEITQDMRLERYKVHDIEVVIDKLVVNNNSQNRIKKSLQLALQQGNGMVAVVPKDNPQDIRYFSLQLMCPESGIAYSEPAPHNFSFNSPKGCCPYCHGMGTINQIDIEKIIPDNQLSIYEGGIIPLGKYKHLPIFAQIGALCENYQCTLKTPIAELPEELIDKIIYGTNERIIIKNTIEGISNYISSYNGISEYIQQQIDTEASASAQRWAEQFSRLVTCPHCQGTRLNQEALHYRIVGKNIAELSDMDLDVLYQWLSNIHPHLSKQQHQIADEIIKEIQSRLSFLLDVGLHYLSLSRSSDSLSGGESQRIRLATQIGSQLVNVLYILDEPSIGLHPRDNVRLITSLKKLRDIGNTIIVVEHDEEMMLASDYIVDMGPMAGRLGGEVVFQGTPQDMLKTQTLTASYLKKEKQITFPKKQLAENTAYLTLFGATGNNLKDVTLRIPLGHFICVTGVSGSGKSSLINGTLYPILSQHFYRSLQQPLPYKRIEGLEHIDKVISVNQAPIGRTPRSNPATYTGLFGDIRNLFASMPEAKIRGYKAGRFSFNVKGGRCETCQGNGYERLEMGFMSDVYIPCKECHGKRYNRETLAVRFKGKSIADVLDMTINQAVEFFENVPNLLPKLKTLQEVGLGYIKLGQSSTTLSGGENQRVKLATELAKRDTGKTLYILDEPTTGLHFEDIAVLLKVLRQLVEKGNTVLLIEHNLDMIKNADYLIDMGPEGGREGGQIIACGTPDELKMSQQGFTAKFL